MHDYQLPGCATRPMASYLKALAVFRLLHEQKDPEVQACWDQDTFFIRTSLNSDEFTSFFVEEYVPTPIITPWNGGSGFYPGDSREGIDAILNTEDSRFQQYKQAISSVLSWPEWAKQLDTCQELMDVLQSMIDVTNPGKKQDDLVKLKSHIQQEATKVQDKEGNDPLSMTLDEIEQLSKDKPKAYKLFWSSLKKARTKYSEHIRQQTKEIIIPLCRSRLPDICLPWLDALCAIHADGKPSYNQILGTGGNDARLDFGNNFMKRISSLLLGNERSQSIDFLSASLWNTPIQGLPKVKIGQFDPGRAGGYNQGMGIEAKDFKANPWDYVLTMEGTLALASSVARRQNVAIGSNLTSPFTVRFSAIGFTSSEYTEPSGAETEIWMPLWPRPAYYPEVKQLFAEGRSSVGRRQAKSGLDFSRAVGTLGVDRGISAFERYGFLKRRGDNKVALPAGKIPVRFRPSLELLNELDPLIARLDQFRRGFQNPPAAFIRAREQIDESIFDCSLQPDAQHFLKIVRSFGKMERYLAQRDRTKEPRFHQPLYGLSPQWLSQCDDGSPEIRVAAAIVSIHQSGKVGPIRSNMAGVSGQSPWQWDDQRSQQHWYGSDLIERLGNVVTYRLMDAERKSVPRVPFQAYIEISPYDVMPFIYEETDDIIINDLLWGFTLIDWRKTGLTRVKRKWKQPLVQTVLSRTWSLLKLLHLPRKIRGQTFKREKSISNLLQAGRIDEACDKAIQRLKVSDLHPFPIHFEEDLDPRRLLASLMIPVKDEHLLEELVLEDATKKGEANV